MLKAQGHQGERHRETETRRKIWALKCHRFVENIGSGRKLHDHGSFTLIPDSQLTTCQVLVLLTKAGSVTVEDTGIGMTREDGWLVPVGLATAIQLKRR